MSAPTEALIDRWQQGEPGAADELFARVTDELRDLASIHLHREASRSLQPTELVNEAYLRLAGLKEMSLEGRTHLRAMASRVMRRVLIDLARKRNAVRRGDGVQRAEIELDQLAGPGERTEIGALGRALERLQSLDPRQARIVELRFFGGLSVDEVAAELDLSTATVGRDWRAARAWLRRELKHAAEGEG